VYDTIRKLHRNQSTGKLARNPDTGKVQVSVLPCDGIDTVELILLNNTTSCQALELSTGPWPINGTFPLTQIFNTGANVGFEQIVDLTGLGCFIERWDGSNCTGSVVERHIATSLRRFILYQPPGGQVLGSVVASWFDEDTPSTTGTTNMIILNGGVMSPGNLCFATPVSVPVQVASARYSGGTASVRQP
jgi:hypothetical protein